MGEILKEIGRAPEEHMVKFKVSPMRAIPTEPYEGQTYMASEKIYYYTGEEWVQADCPPNIQGKSLVLREGKWILE